MPQITVSNPTTSPGTVTVCVEPAPTERISLDIETFDSNGDQLESYQVYIYPPDSCALLSIPEGCWGGFVSDPNGAMQKKAIVVL